MPQNYTDSRMIEIKPELAADSTYKARALAIKKHLRTLGADKFDLMIPETSALPYVIHPDEQIEGIVYGRYKQDGGKVIGRGALIATNDRVLLIDKKPMFVRTDEVIYAAVSGVTYTRVGFIGNITLHSKIGDIKIRTLNQRCAKSFVEAVEARILNSTKAWGGYES